MAALTATNRQQTGAYEPTLNTLTASDTIVYDKTKDQTLVLFNGTASPVGPITIVGDQASATLPIPGTDATYDASAPYELSASLAVGGVVEVNLNTIAQRVVGDLATIAGGTGVTAVLLEKQ